MTIVGPVRDSAGHALGGTIKWALTSPVARTADAGVNTTVPHTSFLDRRTGAISATDGKPLVLEALPAPVPTDGGSPIYAAAYSILEEFVTPAGETRPARLRTVVFPAAPAAPGTVTYSELIDVDPPAGSSWVVPDFAAAILAAVDHVDEVISALPDTIDAEVGANLAGRDVVEGADARVMRTLDPSTGYVWGVFDSADRGLLLIGVDGSITGKLVLPGAAVTLAALSQSVSELVAKPLDPSTGYIWGVFDSTDRGLLLVGTDGTVSGKIVVPAGSVSASSLDAATRARLAPLASDRVDVPEVVGGSLYVWTREGTRRLITSTGSPANPIVTATRVVLFDTTAGRHWAPVTGGAPAPVLASSTQIVAAGDSTVFGDGGGTPWPALLATATGRTVVNFGVGGQTSTEVGLRLGALTPTLTLSAGIPAETTSTAVSSFEPTTSWRPGATFNYSGVLEGTATNGTAFSVPATLTWNGSAFSFARTTAGAAITTPSARFRSTMAGADYDSSPLVFMVGQNNKGGGTRRETDILRDARAVVAWQRTMNRPILVVGMPYTTAETLGTAARKLVDDTNATLAAAFGDDFYDLWGDFWRQGYALAGVTQTSADSAAYAQGVPGPSILADTVHPNAAGKGAVRALIQARITQKGWLSA